MKLTVYVINHACVWIYPFAREAKGHVQKRAIMSSIMLAVVHRVSLLSAGHVQGSNVRNLGGGGILTNSSSYINFCQISKFVTVKKIENFTSS